MKAEERYGVKILVLMLIFILVSVTVPAQSSAGLRGTGRGTSDSGADSWGYRIVFDRSHAQIYSVYDAGFCGYSRLAEVMRDKGFRVEEAATPLIQTVANLTAHDILFLGLSKNMDYSQDEIDAVHSYIRSGGKAIFIGEHDNANDQWKMSLYQNHILADMGVQFRDDEVIEHRTDKCIIPPEENEDMKSSWWFFADGVGPLNGLKDVPVYASASIAITGNATPILTASSEAKPENAVLSALINYGDGRAICIGDSEIIWNGGGKMSIEHGNAEEFVREMLDLLVSTPKIEISSNYDLFTGSRSIEIGVSGEFDELTVETTGGTADLGRIESPGNYTISVSVEDDGHLDLMYGGTSVKRIQFLKEPEFQRFSVLIDERGDARGTDGPDGLLSLAKVIRDSGGIVFSSKENTGREFDACIMVNPTEDVAPQWLREGKRGLIAADFYTTLLYEKPWSSYIRAGWYNSSDIPVKKLFSMANASLSEKLVCNPPNNQNLFSLRAKHDFGFTFPMFNAVSIEKPLGHSLARGESGSWADSYNFFWTEMVHDEEDENNTPVLSYSDNTMFFGSAESLTSQFSGGSGWKYLAESIADWLSIRFSIFGNDISLTTTQRAVRAGIVEQNNVSWFDVRNGSATIPLARGDSGTNLIVEYTYADGVRGEYQETIEQNRSDYQWYMPLGILASIASILTVVFILKKRTRKGIGGPAIEEEEDSPVSE